MEGKYKSILKSAGEFSLGLVMDAVAGRIMNDYPLLAIPFYSFGICFGLDSISRWWDGKIFGFNISSVRYLLIGLLSAYTSVWLAFPQLTQSPTPKSNTISTQSQTTQSLSIAQIRSIAKDTFKKTTIIGVIDESLENERMREQCNRNPNPCEEYDIYSTSEENFEWYKDTLESLMKYSPEIASEFNLHLNDPGPKDAIQYNLFFLEERKAKLKFLESELNK